MIRVDVSCYLENKTGKFRFFGNHLTFFSMYRTGSGSNLNKAIEQFLHTKVIQCRTEEYRCAISCQIRLDIKFGINAFNQFQITTQFVCQRLSNLLIQFLRMYIDFHLFRHHLFRRLIQVQFLLIYIVYSLETCSLLNRPGQRTYLNHQFFLQFIQQVERIFTFTVHLINENNYRSLSHAAHFHQFPCLGFHTFRTVDHDDNAIYRSQRTICIFGKVLVTRSIKDVNLVIPIIKFHYRSRHRDTTLFLNLHPVGCSRFLNLITFYSTRHLNLTTEKQQLFRQ